METTYSQDLCTFSDGITTSTTNDEKTETKVGTADTTVPAGTLADTTAPADTTAAANTTAAAGRR
jgi:hypothetical protein